jgi:hypothetical protein
LDILGFKNLAEDISSKKGLETRRIRDDFIDVVRERIAFAETEDLISSAHYGDSDDWLFTVDSIESVFRFISEVLEHNTGYVGYSKVPLEIGLGFGEYDRWAKFKGTKLFIEDPTIKALRPNIIEYYRDWYEQNEKKRPNSSFVVLTQAVYSKLDQLDKKACQRIKYDYDNKGGTFVFFVADVNKVQQRGKMYKFLEIVGRSGSKIYDRIDDLYVPPVEYEDIVTSLKTSHIAFITGTAEYGKTYTAIRLLWEYFLKGYKPVWWVGEEKSERIEVRKKLEDISNALKPHCIIYFEDPFGKVEYERREILEREIGTIIDTIRNTKDVFVVITSREEVFKEFAKEHLSSVEIKKFEQRLNIKKPSYDVQRRRKLLLKWAEAKGCIWLENARLKNLVVEKIDEEKNLPTPLSIRDFAVSTATIMDRKQLIQKIEQKSEETERSFAREIENMTNDKILFLSFPFIHSFHISTIKREYKSLIKKLGIKNPSSLTTILEWFQDDKIDASNNTIWFSHPSYYSALQHVLMKDGQPTFISERIFGKVLYELSKKYPTNVARTVAYHSDKLVEKERNLILFELAKHASADWAIACAITRSFRKLSENVRDLLLEVSRTGNPWNVAWGIMENIETYPSNVEEVLLWLAERQSIGHAIIYYFVVYSKKLRENFMEELLPKLSQKEESLIALAWAIDNNYVRCGPCLRPLLSQILKNLSCSRNSDTRAEIVVLAKHCQNCRATATEILAKLKTDRNPEVRKRASYK